MISAFKMSTQGAGRAERGTQFFSFDIWQGANTYEYINFTPIMEKGGGEEGVQIHSVVESQYDRASRVICRPSRVCSAY